MLQAYFFFWQSNPFAAIFLHALFAVVIVAWLDEMRDNHLRRNYQRNPPNPVWTRPGEPR